jgi:hypothetical protein
MTDEAKLNLKSLITPPATLSYPALFKPASPMNEGEAPKYGCTLVFTPEDQKHPRFKTLQQAVLQVGRAKFGAEFDELVRKGKIKQPFLTDDDAGYPEGSVFIRPRSEAQPGIVSTKKDPVTGKAAYIEDPREVYAGIRCLASLSCYGYDKKLNRGVTFGLNNLQKLADGPRLDGRKAADNEFDATEDASDEDLNALLGTK